MFTRVCREKRERTGNLVSWFTVLWPSFFAVSFPCLGFQRGLFWPETSRIRGFSIHPSLWTLLSGNGMRTHVHLQYDSLLANDLSACALKTRLKNAGFYSQLKIHVWQRPKERKGIWKSFNHYLPRHFQVTRGSALSLSPDHYFWLAWTRPCFQWCA